MRLEGVPGLHDITQPPGLLLDAMPMEVQLGEYYQVPGLPAAKRKFTFQTKVVIKKYRMNSFVEIQLVKIAEL